MTKRIDNAVVKDIDVTGAVLVSWGPNATDCMYLNGITRPSNISIGDKGHLVYKTGPSYGLWFFVKEK